MSRCSFPARSNLHLMDESLLLGAVPLGFKITAVLVVEAAVCISVRKVSSIPHPVLTQVHLDQGSPPFLPLSHCSCWLLFVIVTLAEAVRDF